MLTVNQLAAAYGKIQVLHGITLHVEKGEIVAIIGSNGAGKSTTLKSILGELKPTGGDVKFLGRSITGCSVSETVKKGIAIVPEGRQIFPHLTVWENLLMGGYMNYFRSKKDVIGRAEEMLDLFPRLKERLKVKAGTVSGGEQQMVAVGRALMTNPQLLMLDEPTLGLAPNIVDNLFSIIADLNSRGLTVLLVEQKAYRALEVSHRTYAIETGKIAVEGKSADLINDTYVKQVYLGQVS
ncbi:ABC transporter ATP-binding protein [Aneurinibacillus tyrosinisolvens]|uniref:ABC transporter ATP-binding protein n=1 Tax=Aneurinibacillus tyrosinisolvens TaxID=1443435 RepID=UPI00063F19C9|nr:ABC transporter ATP-binding protein [Aneurinibacillus tyrosinisolvens]